MALKNIVKKDCSKEPDRPVNNSNILERESSKGESNKDVTELTKLKPSDIKNEVTGKWEKIILLESVVNNEYLDVNEYLLSYYNLYMTADYDFNLPEDKQDLLVHSIINLSNKITTVITDFGDRLQVYEYQYVEKQDGDEKILGRGALLREHYIFKDDGMIIDRSHFN